MAAITSALVGLILAGGVALGSAQVKPLVPDPSECTVAARTPEGLRGLRPGGERRGYGALPPVAVDRAVVEGVTAAVRLYVACLNTGDDYRRYGAATDDYVRAVPSGDGFLVDDAREVASRATPSAVRWAYTWPMPSVSAVTALGDGRVAADLVFSRPEGTTRTTLVWVELGGRWLLDEERASRGGELRPRDVEDFQA